MSADGKLIALLLSIVCFAAPFSPAQAQGVDSLELVVEPVGATIRTCDELAVDLRLRGATAGIAGYQVFLRFPAERFEALRFEPGAVGASVFTAGPPPFGGGLDACAAAADPWDDGAGEDVVAVAASVFGENGTDVLEGDDVSLGRIIFAPLGPSTAEDARFSLNTESCDELASRETLVFSPTGGMIEASFPSEGFGVLVLESPPVEDLSCEHGGSDVRLAWNSPGPPAVDGVEVVRDGERIALLPAGAVSYVDTDVAGVARLSYEIGFLLPGGLSACERSSCEAILEVEFRRGDVDGSGSFNITDTVTLLRSLFRGEPIDCRDAADINDDRSVNISDAIFLLEYLFGDGAMPPPPFPDPGPDPTPDDLGCDSYPRDV